jgi:hypothetical protein
VVPYLSATCWFKFGVVLSRQSVFKIIQEVITISVFIVFAIFFLKEKLAWNYLVAFAFLGNATFSLLRSGHPEPWPESLVRAGVSSHPLAISVVPCTAERPLPDGDFAWTLGPVMARVLTVRGVDLCVLPMRLH